MSFKKQDIYKALESITAPGEGVNLIESNAVTNVVIFGKEILVDSTALRTHSDHGPEGI